MHLPVYTPMSIDILMISETRVDVSFPESQIFSEATKHLLDLTVIKM